MELTEQEARKIYEKLDTSVRLDAQQAWATTYQNFSDNGRPESLLEAAPRDLVATSMSMLFFGILLEQLKRRQAAIERQFCAGAILTGYPQSRPPIGLATNFPSIKGCAVTGKADECKPIYLLRDLVGIAS